MNYYYYFFFIQIERITKQWPTCRLCTVDALCREGCIKENMLMSDTCPRGKFFQTLARGKPYLNLNKFKQICKGQTRLYNDLFL